jgi:hypothetical protein
MIDKIKKAKQAIRNAPTPAALLCSFGKDSMALLHLIREVLLPDKLSCHAYPVPVIWHRHPWFPFKNKFGNRIVDTWSIEVHDYPPLLCGVKYNDTQLELVAKYPFGTMGMDIPLNTESPIPRRDYVCGKEWLTQPKTSGVEWKWRTVFHGHKSSDVDPFEGNVPLKHDTINVAGVRVEFPLREWTDTDVWDYIEANKIPYDKARYENRGEIGNTWLNPDYIHACYRCVDPRETAEQVDCPKLGEKVENVGKRVLRLQGLPEYIGVESEK